MGDAQNITVAAKSNKTVRSGQISLLNCQNKKHPLPHWVKGGTTEDNFQGLATMWCTERPRTIITAPNGARHGNKETLFPKTTTKMCCHLLPTFSTWKNKPLWSDFKVYTFIEGIEGRVSFFLNHCQKVQEVAGLKKIYDVCISFVGESK